MIENITITNIFELYALLINAIIMRFYATKAKTRLLLFVILFLILVFYVVGR